MHSDKKDGTRPFGCFVEKLSVREGALRELGRRGEDKFQYISVALFVDRNERIEMFEENVW